MKKREKFAKEILDIACNGGVIAVTKDNKVVCCRDMNCEQCLFHKKDFYGGYCDDTERIRWSESEYVSLRSHQKKRISLVPFYLILNTLQETPMMHFIFIIISRNVILWIIG